MHRNGNRPWCILRSWRGAFGCSFTGEDLRWFEYFRGYLCYAGWSVFTPVICCMEDLWVWAGCDHFQCCNLSVWKIRKMAICRSLTPVHAAETSIAERGKVLGWHSCGSFTIVFGIHETHARTIHIDGPIQVQVWPPGGIFEKHTGHSFNQGIGHVLLISLVSFVVASQLLEVTVGATVAACEKAGEWKAAVYLVAAARESGLRTSILAHLDSLCFRWWFNLQS